MTVHCELRGVSKSFGAKEVLRDLDLAVAAGEMVAITGPSGSGKTTILNLLGLLEAPDAGEVRLLGAPAPQPRSRGAQQYLRHHLGYLFQNFALVDADTVQQNLDLALTYGLLNVIGVIAVLRFFLQTNPGAASGKDAQP